MAAERPSFDIWGAWLLERELTSPERRFSPQRGRSRQGGSQTALLLGGERSSLLAPAPQQQTFCSAIFLPRIIRSTRIKYSAHAPYFHLPTEPRPSPATAFLLLRFNGRRVCSSTVSLFSFCVCRFSLAPSQPSQTGRPAAAQQRKRRRRSGCQSWRIFCRLETMLEPSLSWR